MMSRFAGCVSGKVRTTIIRAEMTCTIERHLVADCTPNV